MLGAPNLLIFWTILFERKLYFLIFPLLHFFHFPHFIPHAVVMTSDHTAIPTLLYKAQQLSRYCEIQ